MCVKFVLFLKCFGEFAHVTIKVWSVFVGNFKTRNILLINRHKIFQVICIWVSFHSLPLRVCSVYRDVSFFEFLLFVIHVFCLTMLLNLAERLHFFPQRNSYGFIDFPLLFFCFQFNWFQLLSLLFYLSACFVYNLAFS